MPDKLTVATALIRRCEGCRLEPYRDVRGLWSIGFGNRFTVDGSAVTARTQPLAMYQAVALLNDTLIAGTAPNLSRLIKVPLSDCQFGALVSLAYNVGTGALARSSIIACVNRGDMEEAADQFDRWVYAGQTRIRGLVSRRALERAVFLGTVDITTFHALPLPSAPHAVFLSQRQSGLSADILNAQELASIGKPTTSA